MCSVIIVAAAVLENINNLAAHELVTLLLLIYFRRETSLEEMAELLDLEALQVRISPS